VVLLPDDSIMVTGGSIEPSGVGSSTPTTTVLVGDPVTGTFTRGGAMLVARSGHSAVLLPDGGVLLIGGDDLSAAGTAEAWNPASGTAEQLAPPPLRLAGAATQLPDGTLLLSGGVQTASTPDPDGRYPMALALEVYDPTP
jgi:hypothetical protein